MEKNEIVATVGIYLHSGKNMIEKVRGEGCQKLSFSEEDIKCDSESYGKEPRCFEGDIIDQMAV